VVLVCEICLAHQNSPPVAICVSEACQTVVQRIKKKQLNAHLQWWSHQSS